MLLAPFILFPYRSWAGLITDVPVRFGLVGTIAWYLITSTHEQNSLTLAGTTARAALLLQAILLTTFASHRFWALFHLHREYAFKAAIAMSIDGFKQQAPKYEDEITGAAFIELVEKPDHSTPNEAMKSPNPIIDVLLGKVKKTGQK